jgi:hypothetical protein
MQAPLQLTKQINGKDNYTAYYVGLNTQQLFYCRFLYVFFALTPAANLHPIIICAL